MVFAIAGAHRVGKSTTAAEAAKVLGISYIPFRTGDWLGQHSIDPVTPMTPERRLEVQNAVLGLMRRHLMGMPRPGITDRTPLDIAAYTLAEIGMHTGDHVFGQQVLEHVKDCGELAYQQIDAIMVLRPLPVYDAAPGKPPPNLAYQNHIQLLIEAMGIRLASTGQSMAVCYAYDLESRVDSFVNIIKQRMQVFAKLRATATIN